MLLSPALAHPDVNNGPSVTQLFALESCAPLHSPQSHLQNSPSFPAVSSTAMLVSLSLFLSLFYCLNVFFFHFSSSARFIPFFLCSVFKLCALCSPVYCITVFPVRSIYMCMAKSFPSIRICYGVFCFSTSVFCAVIHQPFIFSTEPSSTPANFSPSNSFQIQLNLKRFN